MSDGEYVHYSVYDVKDHCDVRLSLRGLKDSVIRVSCGDLSGEFVIPASEEVAEIHTLTLPAGDEYSLKVEVLSGSVQFDRVYFD